MQNDFRIFSISFSNPLDPVHIILAVMPAKTDIVTAACAMSACIGRKYVITFLFIIGLAVQSHIHRIAQAAMSDHHDPLARSVRFKKETTQLPSTDRDHRPVLATRAP